MVTGAWAETPAAAPPGKEAPIATPKKGAAAGSEQRKAVEAQKGEAVEPAALAALQRMGAYLWQLKNVEIKADTTLDLVTASGQRVQLGGVTQYKVRRPDAFQIDLVTDYMKRRFYYDGKKVTMFSPDLGFYATADAPPTIREVLDDLYDKFGIALPLQDLFEWGDPASKDAEAEKLTSGFLVGPAVLDGVKTDHYAFREGEHDWEVWLEQGDRPLPRKLVIVDRSNPERPTYIARLTWNEKPTFTAADFTFTPGPEAKQIALSTIGR